MSRDRDTGHTLWIETCGLSSFNKAPVGELCWPLWGRRGLVQGYRNDVDSPRAGELKSGQSITGSVDADALMSSMFYLVQPRSNSMSVRLRHHPVRLPRIRIPSI